MKEQELANQNMDDKAKSLQAQNDFNLAADSDNDIDYDEDFDAVRSMN